ncbi:MAG TPA: hypothetical protein VMG41_15155 [Gemmatimonadales bacterium]|nr:hypothetical protein [Gemmatimonadales bacterium]
MPIFSRLPDEASSSDPFRLIRYAIAFLLGAGTIVSLGLWATGVTPRALLLIGALWSVYGLVHAVLDGVLDPLFDLGTEMLENVGLGSSQDGLSYIETMVARGEVDAALAEYQRLAEQGNTRALVRRAGLLVGMPAGAERARIELEEYREGHNLDSASDIRIGLALAHLYEEKLGEPGKAMREFRRLLDLHPTARGLRRVHRELDALKAERFGTSAPATPP